MKSMIAPSGRRTARLRDATSPISCGGLDTVERSICDRVTHRSGEHRLPRTFSNKATPAPIVALIAVDTRR